MKFWIVKILWVWILIFQLMSFFYAVYNRSFYIDDGIQYAQMSENWMQSGNFTQASLNPEAIDSQRVFGYPLFLSFFQNNFVLVIFVQHLLVLLSGFLLYKIAWSLFDKTKAEIAALFYLLQPYPVNFSSLLLSETLFITIFLAFLYFYFQGKSQKSKLHTILSMLSLSILPFIKPVIFPFIIFFTIWNIFQFVRKKQYQNFTILAKLLPLALILLWSFRNFQKTDQLNFTELSKLSLIYARLGALSTMEKEKAMEEENYVFEADSILNESNGLESVFKYNSNYKSQELSAFRVNVWKETLPFYLEHPFLAIKLQLNNWIFMLRGIGWGLAKQVSQNKTFTIYSASLQLILNLLMYFSVLLATFRFKKLANPERFILLLIAYLFVFSADGFAEGRFRLIIDPLMSLFFVYTWKILENKLKLFAKK